MNLERVSYKGWENCLKLGNGKVELAPSAATVLNQGGRLIIPQEPYRPHPEHCCRPARWCSGTTPT